MPKFCSIFPNFAFPKPIALVEQDGLDVVPLGIANNALVKFGLSKVKFVILDELLDFRVVVVLSECVRLLLLIKRLQNVAVGHFDLLKFFAGLFACFAGQKSVRLVLLAKFVVANVHFVTSCGWC